MTTMTLVKDLAIIVVGGIMARCIFKAIENRVEGKDIHGQKIPRKTPKKTYVDWKGNVVLSKEDYMIESAA